MQTETKRVIYVCGPMRGLRYFNFKAFDDLAAELQAKYPDALILSPAQIDRDAGFNPYTLPEDYDWHHVPEELDLDELVRRDIAAVQRATELRVLPGWSYSTGARAEVSVAIFRNIPILFADTDKVLTPEAINGEIASALAQAADTHKDAKNPKESCGSLRLPLHLWPSSATAYGCLGMLEGAEKYGRLNFRGTPVSFVTYISALKRHTDALLEGAEFSGDSKVFHLSNMLGCIAIICDASTYGTLIDDRNYGDPKCYTDLVTKLTPHVARLKEMFKDRNPKHYTIQDTVVPQPDTPEVP